MQRFLAVAIHDVSPVTHSSCQRLLELLQRACPDAPVTLLIVPDHHGRARIDRCAAWRRWVDARIAAGDELALHGFWHQDRGPPPRGLREWVARRLLTDNEAEFAALNERDARERLHAGLKLLEKCGWKVRGFVPPAWQISPQALLTLREFDFQYTSTGRHIERIADGERLSAPALSLSARSGVRRNVSHAWAWYWAMHHRDARMVRLALHPADAGHPDLMKLWSDVIACMRDGRVPMTKGAWVEHEAPDRRSN